MAHYSLGLDIEINLSITLYTSFKRSFRFPKIITKTKIIKLPLSYFHFLFYQITELTKDLLLKIFMFQRNKIAFINDNDR
jgi:hypothetical protein